MDGADPPFGLGYGSPSGFGISPNGAHVACSPNLMGMKTRRGTDCVSCLV